MTGAYSSPSSSGGSGVGETEGEGEERGCGASFRLRGIAEGGGIVRSGWTGRWEGLAADVLDVRVRDDVVDGAGIVELAMCDPGRVGFRSVCSKPMEADEEVTRRGLEDDGCCSVEGSVEEVENAVEMRLMVYPLAPS